MLTSFAAVKDTDIHLKFSGMCKPSFSRTLKLLLEYCFRVCLQKPSICKIKCNVFYSTVLKVIWKYSIWSISLFFFTFLLSCWYFSVVIGSSEILICYKIDDGFLSFAIVFLSLWFSLLISHVINLQPSLFTNFNWHLNFANNVIQFFFFSNNIGLLRFDFVLFMLFLLKCLIWQHQLPRFPPML